METDWAEEFKKQADYRISESVRMLEICLKGIDNDFFWHQDNENTNSIGTLLLHLEGNIRQYILSGLAAKKDTRNRDLEFSNSSKEEVSQVWDKLAETINEAREIISSSSAERLLSYSLVQGFSLSGLGMAMHVVEHLSYHTGQIAHMVKVRNGKALGFYKGIDLNTRNSK
ncbi:DinB family protein [Robiginitalea sp. IMCC43444]|uniref:DinB family protein n=1 Tax=Robiginitalea sp. IMCC43444 TaxID=3459121 RepID=UPI004042385B